MKKHWVVRVLFKHYRRYVNKCMYKSQSFNTNSACFQFIYKTLVTTEFKC